jgi:hypothetical protein
VSQSSVLTAVLLAGFIIYLFLKQRLGVYWSLLTGGSGGASNTQSASPTLGPNAPPITSQGFVPSVPGTTPNVPGTSRPPIGSIDWPNVAPDTPASTTTAPGLP